MDLGQDAIIIVYVGDYSGFETVVAMGMERSGQFENNLKSSIDRI